jgi:hypothetical protein
MAEYSLAAKTLRKKCVNDEIKKMMVTSRA